VAGNRGPALGGDGCRDVIGDGRIKAAAVLGNAGIMHHDAGAAGGQ